MEPPAALNGRSWTLTLLAARWGFDLRSELNGAGYARTLDVAYRSGRRARVYLDQGFGYWQVGPNEQFDFSRAPGEQAKKLEAANPFLTGRGSSYLAIASLGD